MINKGLLKREDTVETSLESLVAGQPTSLLETKGSVAARLALASHGKRICPSERSLLVVEASVGERIGHDGASYSGEVEIWGYSCSLER